MSSMNTLDRAIELVQKAIDEDTKQNYSEALRYYQNALDYFMVALKFEKNEQSKNLLRGKINEYLSRAEKLKDFLVTQNVGGNAGINSNRSASRSTWKSKQDGASDGEGLQTRQPILTASPNVKQNNAAFLDGAGDDVILLDGADHNETQVTGLDGSGGDNEDEQAKDKSPQISTPKLPVWKRIFLPSRTRPRDERS